MASSSTDGTDGTPIDTPMHAVYISSLQLAMQEESIEDAQSMTDALIRMAVGMGFELVDGSTALARERDPIETVVYASTGVFRNLLAQEDRAIRGLMHEQMAGHGTKSDASERPEIEDAKMEADPE